MTSRGRVLLVVVLVVLGMCELGWAGYQGVTQAMGSFEAQISRIHAQEAKQASAKLSIGARRGFTNAEVNAFLDKAKVAEAISDPIQRCIAYPDPPGSHWSLDAVRAYCHYRLQPLLSFAEAQDLIVHGRAAELDRRLTDAMHAQQTQPDARGRLDRIYQQDFDNGSFDIRPTLDAWKRASPNSAFAFAASGVAYETAATDARGSGYWADVPLDKRDAMVNLLTLAASDLERAIALDPKLTPPYTALIDAAMINGTRAETEASIHRGLAAAPDNYSIYSLSIAAERPMWGGSIASMNRLATQAQAHAAANPLLRILPTETLFFSADRCQCDAAVEMSAYPTAFDQLPASKHLAYVGMEYEDRKYFNDNVIYLSEALRFEPARTDARLRRSYVLTNFDEAQWAVTEAGSLIPQMPGDPGAYRTRGYAYEMLTDYAHAEQDYRAALALAPDDHWTLNEMGSMFVHWSHEWDKGWAVTDQLIASEPENPYGWLLRADIQKNQPRAGLKDTVDQFAARFGNNPVHQKLLLYLRAQLALQQGPSKHEASKPLAATKAPAHG